MENNDYNQLKEKIKNLQRSIVQRAIIKDKYIVNDAKNYIDLIYNYSFNRGDEEVQEWFKIKDVIVLGNLHYIKKQRDAYVFYNDISNLDYPKILNILTEYQKYMRKNNSNYDIPFFDFENEIIIKEKLQLNKIIENKEKEDENYLYYHSCYNSNGKILKIKKYYNNFIKPDLAIFAVIHNILIRTKLIPQTDYLIQQKLSEQEINNVYYFQMIILNAIKNEIFDINQKNMIAVHKSNMEYIKIACNNINYYLKIFNHLIKNKVKDIECTIIENSQPGIKINDKDIIYEIIQDDINANNMQQVWTNRRIEYVFSQENKIYYEKLLYEIFKFKEFRKGQLEIISNIMQSTNKQLNIGILPTGYGKSLIYQYMGILQPLKTIILSPTEILLYDQITNLHESEFDLVSVLDHINI